MRYICLDDLPMIGSAIIAAARIDLRASFRNPKAVHRSMTSHNVSPGMIDGSSSVHKSSSGTAHSK